jgi:hypothetical protein
MTTYPCGKYTTAGAILGRDSDSFVGSDDGRYTHVVDSHLPLPHLPPLAIAALLDSAQH